MRSGIQVEIRILSHRVANFNIEDNDQSLRENLDLVEEKCDATTIHTATYQRRMEKYFNVKVKNQAFNMGDLVLKNVLVKNPANGKLAAN